MHCRSASPAGKKQFALRSDTPIDPSLDWKIRFRCRSTASSEHRAATSFGSGPAPHLRPLAPGLIQSPNILECRYPRPSANGTFFRPLIDPLQSPSTTPDSELLDGIALCDAPPPDDA